MKSTSSHQPENLQAFELQTVSATCKALSIKIGLTIATYPLTKFYTEAATTNLSIRQIFMNAWNQSISDAFAGVKPGLLHKSGMFFIRFNCQPWFAAQFASMMPPSAEYNPKKVYLVNGLGAVAASIPVMALEYLIYSLSTLEVQQILKSNIATKLAPKSLYPTAQLKSPFSKEAMRGSSAIPLKIFPEAFFFGKAHEKLSMRKSEEPTNVELLEASAEGVLESELAKIPLDRTKKYAQAHGMTLYSATMQILKNEGVLGLWKGGSIKLLESGFRKVIPFALFLKLAPKPEHFHPSVGMDVSGEEQVKNEESAHRSGYTP